MNKPLSFSGAAVFALGGGLAMLAQAPPAHAASSSDPQTISGDWGGLRTRLEDSGWTVKIRDKYEAAGVLSGGRRLATGANELRIGVQADLGKAFGWKGAKAEIDLTRRSGSNLGPSAGLDPLMPFIEVHGRGDIWRLTKFWYSQDLPGGFNLKLGRDNPGADFDRFRCRFENLTFCGSAPGNMVGDYWFNWPVGQWGARLKLTRGPLYLEAGAYQIDPRNLQQGFQLSFSGGEGVLLPIEAGWNPKLGSSHLPGVYKVGAWWSDADAPDVLLAADGRPRAHSAAPPLQRGRRHGVYLTARQQVTGSAEGRGLTLFARVAAADRRTARLDRQFSLGASFTGLAPGREKDETAIAFGATHVNDRAALEAALASPGQPPIGTEYVTEIDYRIKAFGGATFTPNLQFVRDSGGVSARDATILGFKTVLQF